MQVEALVSLAGYFVLMLGIGLYAYKKSTDDVSGYMLGGRQLHPAVGALSAGASDMSGWMLMGLPGAVYLSGLGAAWIAVGLVIGAYFNYLLVAPRLRVYTEIADDAITIPDYFEKRFHDSTRILRVLSSVVIVIFFTLYTSSGVVAGGKLFEASFGLDYRLGLFLTAGVVIAYTLFGGFLAVSLTDFVQGVIMFIALIMVPIVAYSMLGGLGEIVDTTRAASDVPNYMSMIPDPLTSMGILGIISAMSWGLGYFGQPHIIVRFMAIRTLKDVAVARWIGMTWMVITVIGAVLTGIFGLAFVTQNGAVIEGKRHRVHRRRDDLHPDEPDPVPPAGGRLPARGHPGGDHVDHFQPAAGVVELAHGRLLQDLPASQRQPEGTGPDRSSVRAGSLAGGDWSGV